VQVRIGKKLYETVKTVGGCCTGCCAAAGNYPSMSKLCVKLNESRKPLFCTSIIWKVVDESKNNL